MMAKVGTRRAPKGVQKTRPCPYQTLNTDFLSGLPNEKPQPHLSRLHEQ